MLVNPLIHGLYWHPMGCRGGVMVSGIVKDSEGSGVLATSMGLFKYCAYVNYISAVVIIIVTERLLQIHMHFFQGSQNIICVLTIITT